MLYDQNGAIGKQVLGEGFDTTGMIGISFTDKRGIFSNLAGIALKEEFKKRLDVFVCLVPLCLVSVFLYLDAGVRRRQEVEIIPSQITSRAQQDIVRITVCAANRTLLMAENTIVRSKSRARLILH